MVTQSSATEARSGENPLAEGLELRRRPEPCVLTIFGASGDLTRRKIFPALYALAYRKLLPEQFAVLGVARTEMPTEEFVAAMEEAVREFGRDEFTAEAWEALASRTRYVASEFADEEGQDRVIRCSQRARPGVRHAREPRLLPRRPAGGDAEARRGDRRAPHDRRLDPPDRREAVRSRPRVGPRAEPSCSLAAASPRTRSSASTTTSGKDTVQNLLALRFANGIFEPVWNRQFIDHVQITVAESIGIESRAAFYERAGAIRDVFQNHLLQLVALTGMEPPIDFTAEAVRNEKLKVLKALATPAPNEVMRGQYGPGFIEGEPVPGYREEPKVASDSQTETFVAARLEIENWRWADTPFYVRIGKRLPRRETTIAVEFKRVPHPLFEDASELRPNILIVHIQPNEGVSLAIGAKVPGEGMRVRTVHMDFLYGGAFRTGLPEAYERLILDAMLGDATLFTRSDEIEEQWALVDAIVAAWRRDTPAFPNYPAGTWGPQAAQELVEWHR